MSNENQYKEIARIYRNAVVLLTRGTFTGESAQAVVECANFFHQLAEITDKQANEQEGRTSNRAEAGAGGMGSDGVQNPKRKNSKRKAQ